jgi:hypothetical protein
MRWLHIQSLPWLVLPELAGIKTTTQGALHSAPCDFSVGVENIKQATGDESSRGLFSCAYPFNP